MTAEVDHQEEEQAGAVGRQHEALQPAVVNPRGDRVDRHTQHEGEQLLAEIDRRSRVDAHQAEHQQHPGEQQLEPVEEVEPAEPNHRRGSRFGGRSSSS